MIKNSTSSLNFRKELTFSKESIEGLTENMYVTYSLKRESYPDIINTNQDLDINYRLRGDHSVLGFQRTKYFYSESHKTDDLGISRIYQDQPAKLDKEVYDFLQKNLPKYMKKLIPEQK